MLVLHAAFILFADRNTPKAYFKWPYVGQPINRRLNDSPLNESFTPKF
jgi:hypothetical protein